MDEAHEGLPMSEETRRLLVECNSLDAAAELSSRNESFTDKIVGQGIHAAIVLKELLWNNLSDEGTVRHGCKLLATFLNVRSTAMYFPDHTEVFRLFHRILDKYSYANHIRMSAWTGIAHATTLLRRCDPCFVDKMPMSLTSGEDDDVIACATRVVAVTSKLLTSTMWPSNVHAFLCKRFPPTHRCNYSVEMSDHIAALCQTATALDSRETIGLLQFLVQKNASNYLVCSAILTQLSKLYKIEPYAVACMIWSTPFLTTAKVYIQSDTACTKFSRILSDSFAYLRLSAPTEGQARLSAVSWVCEALETHSTSVKVQWAGMSVVRLCRLFRGLDAPRIARLLERVFIAKLQWPFDTFLDKLLTDITSESAFKADTSLQRKYESFYGHLVKPVGIVYHKRPIKKRKYGVPTS